MTDVTRRDALKAFAIASVAGILDVREPHLERAIRGVESLAESTEASAYAPRFFTQHEWRTVRVLVDYIIPRDKRSGSATDAKVPEFMDFLLADKDATESSKTSMRGGLGWIDNESHRRFGKTFLESTDAQRRQILDDTAWPAKAPAGMSHGVAFFNRLRDFTASGFFSSAMGWGDLQYIGNVFNPNWDGCPPAALAKLGVSYDQWKPRTQ